MCAIEPLRAEGRLECLYNDAPADTLLDPGYCYIDPGKRSETGDFVAGGDAQQAERAGFWRTTSRDGQNAIVQNCPSTQRRVLRFVGQKTPVDNSITFVVCSGDPPDADGEIKARSW